MLDMEKTIDCMDWNFPEEIMKLIGFERKSNGSKVA